MKAIPRLPKEIKITVPRALLAWACESEENKEILADAILDYIDFIYLTNSKITFIEYLRSDDNDT